MRVRGVRRMRMRVRGVRRVWRVWVPHRGRVRVGDRRPGRRSDGLMGSRRLGHCLIVHLLHGRLPAGRGGANCEAAKPQCEALHPCYRARGRTAGSAHLITPLDATSRNEGIRRRCCAPTDLDETRVISSPKVLRSRQVRPARLGVFMYTVTSIFAAGSIGPVMRSMGTMGHPISGGNTLPLPDLEKY